MTLKYFWLKKILYYSQIITIKCMSVTFQGMNNIHYFNCIHSLAIFRINKSDTNDIIKMIINYVNDLIMA